MSRVETTGSATADPTRPWWSRGVSASDRAAGGAPDWAVFVDEALARPWTASDADELSAIVAPLVRHAGGLLGRAARPEVDLAAVRAGFERTLSARLTRLAARALVLELHVLRVSGRLAGGSPRQRFAAFVTELGSPAGLSALFGEYPVLARILGRSCLRAVDALEELLDRLAADRADVVAALLGADPGALTSVDTGVGDGHRGGRSVAVLRFASGARVVYKPRSLAVDSLFASVLAWFGAGIGDELRVPAVVGRDGYGWTAHVAQAPCADRAGLRRFYFRLGALLALLRALDGTDIHYENLIADADQPVLIDVETLFHPSLAPSGQDPAARALVASVYRLALLPRVVIGQESSLDFSGLGGDRGGNLPFDGVAWLDPGTDGMRLVRRPLAFAGAANRPTLHGVDADPAEFTPQLLAGFAAGHTRIARDGRELADLLADAGGCEVRVVLRATRLYGELLDESTHPNLLRDAADHDAVLATLYEHGTGPDLLARVAEDEIGQLRAGDIPFFTIRPDSVDLYSATGRRFDGALAEPGLASVRRNIAGTNEVDLADQEWIIRAAMATRDPADPHTVDSATTAPAGALVPDTELVLAAARGIGDQIVARAYREAGGAYWLGLELLDDRHWQLAPLGASLGTGYCGTALFLAELAQVTGIDRYADVARQALRPVPGLLDSLAARPEQLGIVGTGAFAGLGGIAYALTRLSALLSDADVGTWARHAVELTAATEDADDETGVVTGAAGGLAALTAVWELTRSPAAWGAAFRLAHRLRQAPLPADRGFAQGAAGIGWALSRYAAATGDPACRASGLAALRRAAALTGPLSWCRGVTGIALAVVDSPAAMAEPDLAAIADRVVTRVARQPVLPGHCLCHGEAGLLELLGAAGPVPIERAGALLAAIDRFGPRCGTPDAVPSPGLLTGLAGVGQGLLRLGFPTRVPSGLLLHARPSLPSEGADHE
ncbi:type 2 lanthipeptide synthetase LanM family protein [Catellatospora sp. KI3]|uniref:type 2 lanthipeptide synthetase LanM family protein n=1 Tax=Catellatospora sp. KI3 TaxID=3041620 RepID=UPI002482E56B|nr:type 2 lanthipeptide synthetase LanM family protein [Catellatospora sp. KI3]MDI1465208.1 type 2 lanthipeptide synthetase LanM family protein [Catellatospora sp. KI3]